MTDAIQLIPTDQIDAEALPRDRSVLAPAALIELQRSISTSGLRLPIKLFPTEGGYGLISGYQPKADPQRSRFNYLRSVRCATRSA
ncbi:MAG: hypothetical protein P8X50_15405 [Maritimibacter sp.]